MSDLVAPKTITLFSVWLRKYANSITLEMLINNINLVVMWNDDAPYGSFRRWLSGMRDMRFRLTGGLCDTRGNGKKLRKIYAGLVGLVQYPKTADALYRWLSAIVGTIAE